jgi:hypothetical protein
MGHPTLENPSPGLDPIHRQSLHATPPDLPIHPIQPAAHHALISTSPSRLSLNVPRPWADLHAVCGSCCPPQNVSRTDSVSIPVPSQFQPRPAASTRHAVFRPDGSRRVPPSDRTWETTLGVAAPIQHVHRHLSAPPCPQRTSRSQFISRTTVPEAVTRVPHKHEKPQGRRISQFAVFGSNQDWVWRSADRAQITVPHPMWREAYEEKSSRTRVY